VAALQRAIAVSPGYADAHLRLGIALEGVGDIDGALHAYRQAATMAAAPALALYREAALLDGVGRGAAAIPAYRRAAAAAAGSTLGQIAAARALLAEDRDAEAEAVLRDILAAEPGNALGLKLLGNLLANAGRFAEARQTLLAAVTASPGLAGCFYDITRCGRITPADGALVTRMRQALAEPRLDPVQRGQLHLALGKAAEDLGQPAEAMRHFDAASTLRASINRFDLRGFEALVDRLIARFTPEVIARAADRGNPDPAPVLIIGLPRSGTTLTEQILSAHPAVAAGGELSFWGEAAQSLRIAEAAPDPDALADIAASYLAQLRAIGPGAARVTDKMPLNFLRAGLIHLALPHATLIHCRRAPIDTALSIHATHFNPHMAFPTGGPALVGYIRATQLLLAHWRNVLPPARFVEIDYEILTADPEPEIRRLLAAIGLPWDASCLRPEQNARVVKTASRWQARQPIYRSATARWHAYAGCLGALAPLVDG